MTQPRNRLERWPTTVAAVRILELHKAYADGHRDGVADERRNRIDGYAKGVMHMAISTMAMMIILAILRG